MGAALATFFGSDLGAGCIQALRKDLELIVSKWGRIVVSLPHNKILVAGRIVGNGGTRCREVRITIVTHVGAPYAEIRAYLAQPIVALLLLALVINAAIHMRIGLKEIIEDYVHGGAKVLVLLLATFYSALVGLASVVALLKIGLGS